jgi:hypothetical protein
MRLTEKVCEILHRFDPMGLKSRFDDEYAKEARIIGDLLDGCESPSELQLTIRETFSESFGENLAGPVGRYANIAAVVWGLRRQRSQVIPGD